MSGYYYLDRGDSYNFEDLDVGASETVTIDSKQRYPGANIQGEVTITGVLNLR